MQVKHVTRIGFSSGRSAEQQRHRSISHRMLGKIVINDQDILSLIHKVLRHRAPRIGSDILQRRHITGGRGNHDGILHGFSFCQRLHQLSNGGFLLSDRDIDADHIFAFLVEDRIDRDGSFAGLTVADNQLTLAFADRHHRIDGLDSGLQRLVDRLAHQHAGRRVFDRTFFFGNDRTLAVDRLSERVDHAANQAFPDRHVYDLSGRLDNVAFFDLPVCAKNDNADVILFQVERHSLYAAVKLEPFAFHAVA